MWSEFIRIFWNPGEMVRSLLFTIAMVVLLKWAIESPLWLFRKWRSEQWLARVFGSREDVRYVIFARLPDGAKFQFLYRNAEEKSDWLLNASRHKLFTIVFAEVFDWASEQHMMALSIQQAIHNPRGYPYPPFDREGLGL